MAGFEDIKKEQPFKVPQGYFGGLADDIDLKIKEEYIRNTCGQELPFDVPENYFNNLGERISRRTVGMPAGRRTWLKVLAPYAAVAAVFIFIVLGWQLVLNKSNNAEQAEITTQEKQEDTSETNLIYTADNLLQSADSSEITKRVDLVVVDISVLEIPEITNAEDEPEAEYEAGYTDEELEDYLTESVNYEDIIAEL
ncbi:MAG: hypothetical protein U9N85_01385 [Bacteroidota bacterium]|nr:hypothetical protein [Bacteroidota bacterium]